MKILLAEDSSSNQLIIKSYIEKAGHEIIIANNGKEAVDLFKSENPDLVLMDVTMPVMDGIEATKAIRELTKLDLGWVPIIFLSGLSNSEDIAHGIDVGGDDYLIKPVDSIVLKAKLQAMQRIAEMRHQLNKANHKLKAMAVVDGLTEIANRRFFDEVYMKELKRSFRNKNELSLILCDIDHFKLFNDNYGHQAGDDCLKSVASTMVKTLKRPSDFVARYGGEEFVFVLPNTDLDGAKKVAESINKAIESESISHAHSLVSNHLTLSCGVASVKPQLNQDISLIARNLLESADKALYTAKEKGRNQVVTAK
ncbi:MAG: diguanylate cyclase [Enterobacterales bacterium]|nr:diguanylate cyclase [Enterobacterales bacterium]